MKKINNSYSPRNYFTQSMCISLFLLCFCVVANAQININQKGGKFSDIINTIKSQSDYQFFYEDKIKDIEVGPLELSNVSIEEALNKSLTEKGVTYKIEDETIYLSSTNANNSAKSSQQTTRTIKGTVKDEAGEPLIGVTVSIKGTTVGTITDMNGYYIIKEAHDGDEIQFSYISYVPVKLIVKGDMTYDAIMKEDNIALGQVVVTALGIRREAKALTYNVQEIKGSELTVVKDANFINSLAGKVAGVQINQSASGIGGSARVVMRGTKSIMSNNNALYVVDGVPLYDIRGEQPEDIFESPDGGDGDAFSNINPEDIESLSVLSGPAAAPEPAIFIRTNKSEQISLKNYYLCPKQ